MSYTQVYRFQNLPGYESVISKGNSDMTYMGFARILLKAGESLEYTVTGEEQAIVLQQGDFQVWAEYEGKMVIDGREGQRGNVYDDMPTAVYLPPKAKVKFTSKNGCEARVYTAYCEEEMLLISAPRKRSKRASRVSTFTSGNTALSLASPVSITTISPST